ncbi:MAG: hypothetical protein RR977_04250, partial [Oscillospiraceae bacterium]
MKNKMRIQILAGIMSVCMLFSVGNVVIAADQTNVVETVYVLLNPEGAVREIIVKNNGIEQKNATGELPFNIQVSYWLNEEKAVPTDILGKSGNVKMTVQITANNKAKTSYKENLALQMQLPINMADGGATDLVANGLTGVTVGAVKTLSGIVLPSKSATYEISYTTEKFELQSINFVCMPFDLAGMTDIDFSATKKQIQKLQNGITQYVDGVGQANKGLSQANTGIKQISANGSSLVSGYKQTTDGTNALIGAMLAAMPPEQQQAFQPQVQAIQAGQKQISDSLAAYTGGVSKASTGLALVTSGMGNIAKNGVSLKAGVNQAINPLLNMESQMTNHTAAESFLSSDPVSEIQFVMKTDALTATQTKEDV